GCGWRRRQPQLAESWVVVDGNVPTSDDRAHRVELVRPGPSALRWLRATVAALQGADRLAPVTVVVPSPYIGLVARRALAADRRANVRTLVLRQVAARVGGG